MLSAMRTLDQEAYLDSEPMCHLGTRSRSMLCSCLYQSTELDHDHGGGDCDSPETNFTIDGTNWYSVWHYYSYGGPYDPTVDDGRRIARGIHGERVCQPNWRNRDNVEEVTKRIGMSGRPREKVTHGSAEFLEIMEAYDRLTELVSAVAAKEPPEQS